MINTNSIEIYKTKIQPSLKKRHDKVMTALAELGEGNLYDIADKLGVPVHAISGRLTELSGSKEYGRPIIEACGMKNNRYGNPCIVWRLKNYQPVAQIQNLF